MDSMPRIFRTAWNQNGPTRSWYLTPDANPDLPTGIKLHAPSVCDEGIRKYVYIPDNVREIDIIFYINQPGPRLVNNWFLLTGFNQRMINAIGIQSVNQIAWTRTARRFLKGMFVRGYRYATVEYIDESIRSDIPVRG